MNENSSGSSKSTNLNAPGRPKIRSSTERFRLALLAAGLVWAGEARGQTMVDVWTGASFVSRGPIALVEGRRFFVAGARVTRPVVRAGAAELRLGLEIIPAAIVTDNPTVPLERIPDDLGGFVVTGDSSTVYGAGFNPFLFELYPWRTGVVDAFITGSAGALWFGRAVPFANARRFNFTAEVGWGVEVRPATGWRLAAGYKVHHLSNAGTADENPGLDARIWFVSLRVTP